MLPTEDQEAEGVVVEWKRVSEPSILNSAYWKNSLPITKGEPVVNPEETSAQPQTTEVPSDSTEPVGPLTVVRKPEAAPVPEPAEGEENSDEAPPSPSMPRRIITPLNSTFHRKTKKKQRKSWLKRQLLRKRNGCDVWQ